MTWRSIKDDPPPKDGTVVAKPRLAIRVTSIEGPSLWWKIKRAHRGAFWPIIAFMMLYGAIIGAIIGSAQ